MKKELFRMLFIVLFLCSVFSTSGAYCQEKQPLSFGIVPQQSAAKLARTWGPVLLYLSQKTGMQLLFNTATDIPTFEKRLASGEYDIAYMNPYHYTVFHESPGYIAFAKEKDKRIQGIVVVRKDSPIKSITELKGKTLAFPAPAAFAASVLPRAYFHKNGINIIPQFVSSHDSVYLTVAQEIYPAGGGIVRTYDNIDARVRDQLRILWYTDKYTPHAIAAHPRISTETISKLQEAMISMGKNPKGLILLQAINFSGIEKAVDTDWNDVRALDIHQLDNLIDQ